MRVVVPYSGPEDHALAPLTETVRALQGTGREFDMVHVGGSDRAYFDRLMRLWTAGAAFAIVEHDIVVHPTALDELSACPSDWCAFPYEIGPWGLQYGLGCVKFSADLIVRNPDAMIKVGVMSDAKHPKRHWCRLDAWLQGVILPNAGERLCRHGTPVRHLGSGNSHGCISGPI